MAYPSKDPEKCVPVVALYFIQEEPHTASFVFGTVSNTSFSIALELPSISSSFELVFSDDLLEICVYSSLSITNVRVHDVSVCC